MSSVKVTGQTENMAAAQRYRADHGDTAVILAGGAARRWGGQDKTAALVNGVPVLGHVVAALAPLVADIVIVAPQQHAARAELETQARVAGPALRWTREEPAGGGPAAGLAAALSLIHPGGAGSQPPRQEHVVLLVAGDLPCCGPALPRLLVALRAAPQLDGVVGLDPAGRRQPLLAAYRLAAIWAATRGPVTGLALRTVVDRLMIAEIAVSTEEAFDLDTPERLTALQTRRP